MFSCPVPHSSSLTVTHTLHSRTAPRNPPLSSASSSQNSQTFHTMVASASSSQNSPSSSVPISPKPSLPSLFGYSRPSTSPPVNPSSSLALSRSPSPAPSVCRSPNLMSSAVAPSKNLVPAKKQKQQELDSNSSTLDPEMADSPASSSSSSSSPVPSSGSSHSVFDGWKERVLYPTIIGGVVGGAVGLVSKHRKTYGLANISATYATNIAIVTGCYCGAREFVRVTRKSKHDDLVSSAVGGFCSGAVLGRLQGGQLGAVRYSVMFAIAGTAVDYATLKLRPVLKSYRDSILGGELKLPEWSPIQILDEEALAAKRAREEQLRAQRAIIIRDKEAQMEDIP